MNITLPNGFSFSTDSIYKLERLKNMDIVLVLEGIYPRLLWYCFTGIDAQSLWSQIGEHAETIEEINGDK